MLILVPVVLTPDGDAALQLATEEAQRRGAQVILVGHSQPNPDTGEDLTQLRERLDSMEASLADSGVDCEALWSVGSQTLDENVVKLARERDVDLIVMGLRRRSRVGKLLLGSYEQAVLLGADCPVLTVKAPRD